MGTVIEFLTVCHWCVAGSRPSWARALRTSLTWLGGRWTLRWKPSSSLWDKSPGTLSTCCPWQTSPCRFLDRPGRSRWERRGIQRVSSPLGNQQHHPIKLIWEVIFWKQNLANCNNVEMVQNSHGEKEQNKVLDCNIIWLTTQIEHFLLKTISCFLVLLYCNRVNTFINGKNRVGVGSITVFVLLCICVLCKESN